jgi:hypothetical protein
MADIHIGVITGMMDIGESDSDLVGDGAAIIRIIHITDTDMATDTVAARIITATDGMAVITATPITPIKMADAAIIPTAPAPEIQQEIIQTARDRIHRPIPEQEVLLS